MCEDGCNQTRLALSLERFLADEHLVEDGPKRKDVRACVGLFAFELLGRHVLKRPEYRPLRRQTRRRRR